MDFASAGIIVQHAFPIESSLVCSLAARSFVESLIHEWKGIGHLVDFIFDGSKAGSRAICVAIIKNACYGLFQG